jgi:uncharacterized membrane-anchored protein
MLLLANSFNIARKFQEGEWWMILVKTVLYNLVWLFIVLMVLILSLSIPLFFSAIWATHLIGWIMMVILVGVAGLLN